MADKQVHDQPSEVTAQDGAVAVKGPGTVDVTFTPDAAEETSERMLNGAMKARGQDYFNRRRPK